MNNTISLKITNNLLVSINQIITAIQADKDFLVTSPTLIDALVFINIRLLVPFMLNLQSFADPIFRLTQNAYRLDKNLKDLLKVYYSAFKLEDRTYMKFMSSDLRTKNLGIHKHLILNNLSKLMTLVGTQADESILMPILICVSSFDDELTKQ